MPGEEEVRRKAYNEARREENKAYQKAYYETHRETRRKENKAYYEAHREERKARQKVYREAHREEIKTYWVLRTYNVSLQDAEMLVALRDGEGAWCDICRTTAGPFEIDHDHETGKIRGILCKNCNLILRRKLSIQIAQAIIEYLSRDRA